jgi:hypothetical protein
MYAKMVTDYGPRSSMFTTLAWIKVLDTFSLVSFIQVELETFKLFL